MNFVRKLLKFNVCKKLVHLFYEATVQSVLAHCVTCLGGSVTSQSKKLARKFKAAIKISGSCFPSMDVIFGTAAQRKAN